jgi:hypothetical protein
MKAQSSTLSLTSALDGLGGQRDAPVAFPSGNTGTYCTGKWVGPRAGWNRCGKSRPHWYSIPGQSSP